MKAQQTSYIRIHTHTLVPFALKTKHLAFHNMLQLLSLPPISIIKNIRYHLLLNKGYRSFTKELVVVPSLFYSLKGSLLKAVELKDRTMLHDSVYVKSLLIKNENGDEVAHVKSCINNTAAEIIWKETLQESTDIGHL